MTGPRGDLRVLVVEDQQPVAAMIQGYLERIEGFHWVGSAASVHGARAFLTRHGVDLVLLDVRLPDGSGLGICQALRACGSTIGVIAVTSARDLEVVRAAMACGISQYVLKPFTFDVLRAKLLQHAQARQGLDGAQVRRQDDVDRLIGLTTRTGPGSLPANLSRVTMTAVVDRLAEVGRASASELAEQVGVSRSTARRYLEHLIETGRADQTLQYGRTGRPQVIYRSLA